MPSPTQRSLKMLRENGLLAEKVEQRLPIPGKFVTRDLFNFIDVIAADYKNGLIIGVQITTMSNMSSHRAKIANEPRVALWKRAGGKIQLHGWRKVGPKGKRKLWEVHIEEL